MTEYKTPGVYVEEISKFPPSVAGVATAIPAFIGITEKYPTDQPVRITSLLDFEEKFGYGPKLKVFAEKEEGKDEEHPITTTETGEGQGDELEGEGDELEGQGDELLDDQGENPEVGDVQGDDDEYLPGDDDEVNTPLRLMREEGETEFPTYKEKYTLKGKEFVLYDSIRLFYDNGGGVCYVASIGTYEDFKDSNPEWDSNYKHALDSLKNIDEVTLLLAPDAAMLLGDNLKDLQKKMLEQCDVLGDRFAILDLIEEDELQDTLKDFREGVTDHLSYGAAYYPNLISSYTKDIDFESVIIALGGVPTILGKIEDTDTKKKEKLHELFEGIEKCVTDDEKKLRIKAIIPQIPGYAEKLAELQTEACVIPPSGAIAGIYAANDSSKGVWQAPANVGIASISGLTRRLSDADQEDMNVDANTGKSVNAIRYFAGKGILVWGARTLDGNSNEWRYVPVRRLFNYIEESVQKSTAWAVFQPNDANTWVKIQCQIENFLNNLWRDGALAGSSPEKAFYVKVGQDITMTAADILAGYLIVEIGIAAVRPAEFIVLKFSHKLQEA